MVRWIARIMALLVAIAIFAAIRSMRQFEGGFPGQGRILGALIVALLFALAFVWFSEESSDYLGLSQSSYSGGPGPQLLYVCGWLILLLLAGVAVVMRVAA